MDKEAMLAAQRADPHRIVFSEAAITRTLGTLARYKRRRKPTREAAIAWLHGQEKRAAERAKIEAARRRVNAKATRPYQPPVSPEARHARNKRRGLR